jgi:hypothetical protein
MANSAGPKGCGRDVPHPISSGWSGSGPRAAGTVADLSCQLEAWRLPGINDSDSDSSGRGGRRQVDQDGGGQDHPAAARAPDSESEEEAGPAVGEAAQVNTYTYLQIHADTYVYLYILINTFQYLLIHQNIPTDTYRYIRIPTYTYTVKTWIAFHSVTDHALPVSVQQYLPLDAIA